MRMLRMYAAITTLLACSAAHPAYQHQFHNILDRNPCLKKCFDVVGKADQELNLIKAANVSGYMLNLGQICSMIDTSRKCIDACGEKSNPFALRTMREVCTPRVFDELQRIGECLFEEGDEIFDACRNACGNYDEMNKQVSELTNAMKSTPNDPVKVAEVMTKTNEACATLKCSHRCTVAQYTETCGPMYRDGRDVGAIVKSLIERVLLAQRKDLDEMGLTDQLVQTMPANCNYMYMPEVMFNSTKDELAQLALEDAIREERSRQKDVVIPTERPQSHQPTQGELNLALARMQAMVLRKQLQLLDMQEQNVRRESYKLDMEMNLLRKKQISL